MGEVPGFRLASWDTPLRANPNRHAGRWNGPGAGATQYISLHPLGAWAEYLRWHGIRDWAQARELRLGIWALRLSTDEIVSVSFETAAEVGLQGDDLVSDDWSACQAAGDRLRADRSAPRVLRVPSAALPGTDNVVILEPRVGIPFSLDPLDSVDVPVTLAAAGARPPQALLAMVRQRGEKHAALEAWQCGVVYRFVEPSDALLAADVHPEAGD